MVFEWVTAKFKERQLKKAQIQAEADHMVIVSGLSILNPTARTFFKDMPFYNVETDAIDFKELEQYICDLKYWRGCHLDKECKACWPYEIHQQYFDRLNKLVYNTYEETSISYNEKIELEKLRKEVKQLREDTNIDELCNNYNNKIYQKNKEIERLQTLLDKGCSKEVEIVEKEVPKIVYKDFPKDDRPIKRESKIYRKFKLSVLKRDKVCQCCGSTENIHVHHLNSFKHYNQLGADPNNGIALCEDCHNQFHSIYGKLHHNNAVNFAKFLREYGKSMQVDLDYISQCSVDEMGGK